MFVANILPYQSDRKATNSSRDIMSQEAGQGRNDSSGGNKNGGSPRLEGSGRNSTPKTTRASSSKQQQHEQQRENRRSAVDESSSSPRQKRRSPNKIYRAPPTPEPIMLNRMERSFTLDCIAVNTTSNDYAKAKPKLGQVIPPYNAHNDKSTEPYFNFKGVSKTLKRNGQIKPGCSIEGPVVDRFYESGAGYKYLYLRNKSGAGHSHETIDGHGQFLIGMQPIDGYNGRFGYRRNTPSLRYVPSQFGVATNEPIH